MITVTNLEADNYLTVLKAIADKTTGKIGYAVSRNIRKLMEELQEYSNIKFETITKYGEPQEDGNYSIKVGTDAYDKYIEDMERYDTIRINVDIMKINPEDLFDSKLTASDMLAIDFMLEEEKDAESV